MIAAHGKGKSDGASALLRHMEKHAPEYAARVLRTVLRAESEAGGESGERQHRLGFVRVLVFLVRLCTWSCIESEVDL